MLVHVDFVAIERRLQLPEGGTHFGRLNAAFFTGRKLGRRWRRSLDEGDVALELLALPLVGGHVRDWKALAGALLLVCDWWASS